jgi:hypothetical protein
MPISMQNLTEFAEKAISFASMRVRNAAKRICKATKRVRKAAKRVCNAANRVRKAAKRVCNAAKRIRNAAKPIGKAAKLTGKREIRVSGKDGWRFGSSPDRWCDFVKNLRLGNPKIVMLSVIGIGLQFKECL